VYVLQLSGNDRNSPPTLASPSTCASARESAAQCLHGYYPPIQLPTNSINLTGQVTDDASERDACKCVSKFNGPAPVTFANPGQTSTQVTFPVAGSYQLRLTASDRSDTYSDANIIVNPADQAPNRNAEWAGKLYPAHNTAPTP